MARLLSARGWTILARNVHAGRSELDIVAVEPGALPRLAVIEVRWRSSRQFGLPEETFDARKRGTLIAGLGRLLDAGCLPDGAQLPHLPIALHLAVVEPGPTGRPSVKLYRDALA